MPRKKPRLDPDRPRLARAYGRVSRIGDRGKGTGRELWSPSVQIENGELYFARLGIPFDKAGSQANGDWDESAFDRPWRERPGILKHYLDAKSGIISDLSFYLLSRLGRDLAESLDLIAAFEEAGCLLHFPNEGITPGVTGALDSGAKLLRNIRLALAETESEDKRLWSRAAALKRAQAGKPIGECPMWIIKTPDGYALHEPIAAAIAEAVRLRLAGLSLNAITRKLNDEGYRTKEGREWRATTIRKYLTGSFIDTLLGHAFFNRDLPEGDADRVLLPHCWPAIITEREAALLRVTEERRRHLGNWALGTTFLLSGKIRCTACGYARIAVGGSLTGKSEYKRAYTCHQCKVRTGRDGAHKYISAYQVDDAVIRFLRWYIPQEWPAAAKRTKRQAPTKDAIADLKNRRRRLLQLHLSNAVSEDDYNAERIEIENAIEKIEAAQRESESSMVFQQARQVPQEGRSTQEYLRALVLLLIDKVEAPVPFPTENQAWRVPGDFAPRTAVRIRLNAPPYPDGPTVFYAPLYRKVYAGERNLYVEGADGTLTRLDIL